MGGVSSRGSAAPSGGAVDRGALAARSSPAYSERTSGFTARAHHGRITLDVPADLPEGAVLEFVPASTWEDLDEDERAALEADLDASEEDLRAGRHEFLSDIIAALRPRR